MYFDIGFILIAILSVLVTVVLPIAIVVWIVRYFYHRSHPHEKKKFSFGLRELIITSIVITAGFAGISGIVLSPITFFDVEDISDSSTALFIYLVASMVLLMLGIALKDLTGKFLMILGVIILLFSVVPFIGEVGSSGAFIALLLVFVSLVAIIIRVSRKESRG